MEGISWGSVARKDCGLLSKPAFIELHVVSPPHLVMLIMNPSSAFASHNPTQTCYKWTKKPVCLFCGRFSATQYWPGIVAQYGWSRNPAVRGKEQINKSNILEFQKKKISMESVKYEEAAESRSLQKVAGWSSHCGECGHIIGWTVPKLQPWIKVDPTALVNAARNKSRSRQLSIYCVRCWRPIAWRSNTQLI